MSDQETALKAALARAEEAETNMKLAAQYGQELIEKLSKSEKIQVELEQEKHSLKLQLQSKESNEQAMQDEINGMCWNQHMIFNLFEIIHIKILEQGPC